LKHSELRLGAFFSHAFHLGVSVAELLDGDFGGRIQTAVKDALHAAMREGKIHRQMEFYASPHRPIVVRDRSSVSSAGLKKAEHLPTAEIEAAIRLLVKEYMGATRDELPTAILRVIGFKSTSVGLRAVVENAIDRLVMLGRVSENRGILTTAKPATNGEGLRQG
jgi:hypothetical protein